MPLMHGVIPRSGDLTPLGQFVPTGKFGRMFPYLAPLQPGDDALSELGASMFEKAADAAKEEGDNPEVPAGYTYLGQFIDHDITFDPTTLQESNIDPLALRNFRTPALDLDCLYGAGPSAQPYLFQRENPALFEIGRTSSTPGGGDASVPVSQPFDLPRAPNGFATIGDPRNDENLVVGQLHLAFMRFHNKVVSGITDGSIVQESPIRKEPFEEARDLVIWHYQWIILHDFLPKILDTDTLEAVMQRGSSLFQREDQPYIPVEFSAAAYRLGHSMVRAAYDYNRVFTFRPGGVTAATLELLFRFSGRSGTGSNVPIPSDWIIDWRRFFEIEPATAAGKSRRINALLAAPLGNIPGLSEPLSTRNLKRGSRLGLPSAQSIARYFGIKSLRPSQIATGEDGRIAEKHRLHVETPLWYYILKEAEVLNGGRHLGPLGSRIVAEVFVGLLKRDSSSFVARKPQWTPCLPRKDPATFTVPDLLRFAGDLNPIG